MSFIVMRRPVMMEDEARHFFEHGPFATREEAADKIKELTTPHTYFYPGDYYIMEGGD
jgi:hypothetical protein